MPLHQFMTDHRHEILQLSHAWLRNEVMEAPELERDVALFFDEVLQALRRHDGVSSAISPLPGYSDTAARLGKRPQHSGLNPTKVPAVYSTISRAIGEIGELNGLTIGADEYHAFNACIDSGVATSIENFWNGENERREQRIQERFGYLAHELRIALGNAAMAFKLLRAGDLELTGRTAGVLATNLVRMETIVARTLGAVQLDSSVPLQTRPIRVATLLRQLQASAIPERAISVTLEVDESLHVNADEMLLTSAVSNLLHNAVKFSRAGARVALVCRAEDAGVMIEVEDECGGLPDGSPVLALSEEPGLRPEPPHLGQGLAITQRAVEAMDGQVRVQNLPGHGCVFSLLFPLARRSRSSAPPPPPFG
jgi:signal transduction histidine kinase